MKKLFALLAFLVLTAVAASPAEAQERRTRANRDRIAAAEIQETRAASVYDLIQSKRSFWLSRYNRTGDLMVFLDGAEVGDVNALKQIPTGGVTSVQYLNSGQVKFQFGKYTEAGAISVRTDDEDEEEGSR